MGKRISVFDMHENRLVLPVRGSGIWGEDKKGNERKGDTNTHKCTAPLPRVLRDEPQATNKRAPPLKAVQTESGLWIIDI